MDRRNFLKSTTIVGAGSAALLVAGTANAASCVEVYAPEIRSTAPGARLTYPIHPDDPSTPTDYTWPPGHVNRYA